MIEVKYGDKALQDKSGIISHLEKANSNCNIDGLKSLQNEMKNCLNQKRELGLIPELTKDVINFKSQSKIDFIFILINHDPASSILKEELDRIDETKYPNLNIKFAVSNFAGYGLYKENIFSLEKFKEKFKEQIFCK